MGSGKWLARYPQKLFGITFGLCSLEAGCQGTRLGCLIHFKHRRQPYSANGDIPMGTMAVGGIP